MPAQRFRIARRFAPALLATASCLVPALLFLPGCKTCVRKLELDPVATDLRHLERQIRALAPEQAALDERIQEFGDKVFVNQQAALDLLDLELVALARRFAARLRKVRVETRMVRRTWRKQVRAYETLARSFQMLQQAFRARDNDAIRRGITLYERGLKEREAARLALQRLRRKFRLDR